jgi:hypothetical protein
MSDPQYNTVDTNSLESVGRRKTMARKIKGSSVTYPQKRITGQEKKVNADPTTSPKRVTKKSGAKKYVKVKATVIK